MTTIWQENAQAFASRADQYIRSERNQARQKVLELLVDGKPGHAFHELVQSVNRQLRAAGVGHLPIESCPCGGRCENGRCGR